jgi:hypothetical protein
MAAFNKSHILHKARFTGSERATPSRPLLPFFRQRGQNYRFPAGYLGIGCGQTLEPRAGATAMQSLSPYRMQTNGDRKKYGENRAVLHTFPALTSTCTHHKLRGVGKAENFTRY